MVSQSLSAFFGLSLTAVLPPPTPNRCIQPEMRLVHAELRLLDVTVPVNGFWIESSSGSWPIGPYPAGAVRRLQLDPDERIRFRSETGQPSDWFDPFLTHPAEPEALETPAWALGAVWYNVFPERFDNANPASDQGWPNATPIPWDQDWFAVTPDELEASANRAIADPRRFADAPRRSRPPLHDTVFERRYGGDLQGLTRRLDHIQSLGATALWLCPVFDSDSLHKYDAADHRHIDPHLAHPVAPAQTHRPFSPDPAEWGWTPADRFFLDELLPAAKSRGFRLILDGVWNHIGTAHPAFQDALERGSASPFFDWFEIRLDTSGHAAGWRAWDRTNGNLPAFRQIEGDLAPGPKDHVFHVTSRWMDPNADGDPSDGIDGWRLDVANEVGFPFWRDWRAHVREINPDAALYGELWFDGSDYFGGAAFDAQMNYPLAFVLLPWLSGVQNPEIARDIERTMNHHPATVLAQMNLLASHDTARLVSLLANPGLGYDQGAGLNASNFNRDRPPPEAYERLELAYAVLNALPGSPMVFAGDEIGVWGGDDPENRKPLPWPDLAKDPELAQLATRTTDRIAPWLRVRSDPEFGPVLRYGGVQLSTINEMLVIERDLSGLRLALWANPTDETQPSTIGPVPPRSARLAWTHDSGRWSPVILPSEKQRE